MVFEMSVQSFIPEKLRVGREGKQIERSFRSLLFLLHGWCKYSGRQGAGGGSEEGGILGAIYFDKLALFLYRIWNEIYQRTGANVLNKVDFLLPQEETELVTFPSPFKELRGKHGRGIARHDGKRKPIYLIQILYELQQNNILHYFEITPHPEAPDVANDYRTTVGPAVPITSPENDFKDFTHLEFKTLMDLENSLKRLSAAQIRALGTHENYQKTLSDINKEFKDLEPHHRVVIERITKGNCFFDDSRELMEYCEEAWRKSTGNRNNYSDAYNIMLTEIKTHELRNAFLKRQSHPDQIWKKQDIIELSNKAGKFRAFAKYLHSISYYRNHIKERVVSSSKVTKMFGYLWHESLVEMRRYGFKGLPNDINDIFIGSTNQIKHDVREKIVSALESLSNG